MVSSERIKKEIKEMNKSKDKNITAKVSEHDFTQWSGTIIGPKGTPYENGVYRLKITLPRDYPFKPPKILFETKIYHCNISSRGDICLDILKDGWSPALTIEKTLLSLVTLLEHPNPNDPLEPTIANEMKRDNSTYLRKAKEITNKFAIEKKVNKVSDEDDESCDDNDDNDDNEESGDDNESNNEESDNNEESGSDE
jgi:ubiquitin-protein ligase